MTLSPGAPSNNSSVSSHAKPVQIPAPASTRLTLTPIGGSKSQVANPASNSAISGSTVPVAHATKQPARIAIAPSSPQSLPKSAPKSGATSTGSLAVATVRGLPAATKTVLGGVGKAAIASEKAAGQDIAAAIGASAYQKKIMQIRATEQASFTQLVKQRDSMRTAGKDTSKLDTQIKNFKYTPDDTTTVFPALKKSNGQVIGDFAGVALDATTGGLSGQAKAARGAGAAVNVVRETSVVGGAKAVETARTVTQASFSSPKGAEAVAASAGSSRDFKTLLEASRYAGGHPERHVAQTSFDLAGRLSREPKIQAASTFRSQAEQEAALNKAFDVNSQKIQTWVNGGAKSDLKIDALFSGGAVLERGASTLKEGSQVRAILRGNSSGGYYLLTAFPRP